MDWLYKLNQSYSNSLRYFSANQTAFLVSLLWKPFKIILRSALREMLLHSFEKNKKKQIKLKSSNIYHPWILNIMKSKTQRQKIKERLSYIVTTRSHANCTCLLQLKGMRIIFLKMSQLFMGLGGRWQGKQSTIIHKMQGPRYHRIMNTCTLLKACPCILTGKKPGGMGPPGIPSWGGIWLKGLGAGAFWKYRKVTAKFSITSHTEFLFHKKLRK